MKNKQLTREDALRLIYATMSKKQLVDILLTDYGSDEAYDVEKRLLAEHGYAEKHINECFYAKES